MAVVVKVICGVTVGLQRKHELTCRNSRSRQQQHRHTCSRRTGVIKVRGHYRSEVSRYLSEEHQRYKQERWSVSIIGFMSSWLVSGCHGPQLIILVYLYLQSHFWCRTLTCNTVFLLQWRKWKLPPSLINRVTTWCVMFVSSSPSN